MSAARRQAISEGETKQARLVSFTREVKFETRPFAGKLGAPQNSLLPVTAVDRDRHCVAQLLIANLLITW
jgi:hypothetical protein